MNVVRETGLFQGSLRSTNGIVVLEDGSEEFSNIHGLGKIRCPAGDISARFDEVRQACACEGLL